MSVTSENKNEIIEQAVETPEAQLTAEESIDKFMPELVTVSPSPHIRAGATTRTVMLDVCIALMPALIWGIYVFGWRALTLTAVSVLFATLAESAYLRIMKRPSTVLDFSAVVTGLLLALNLPVSVPLWVPAVGSVFAIIVVKQLFGGIGRNFMNPALAARVFLFLAWATYLSTFPTPGTDMSAISIGAPDVASSATPLASLKNAVIPESPSLINALMGYEAGCIGEVSALLLAAGFVYMLVRRIVTWHIPVAYIGTVFFLALIFPQGANALEYALWQILSGGLFLGAIFMATDYSTSPITPRGRIIYGIGCGALTVFIRYFGAYPEGVSFSILIMNLLVWYIDLYTKPRKFGGAKNGKSK